jgi:fermentation-respiration switch protein FrsA (DUF1100 family)
MRVFHCTRALKVRLCTGLAAALLAGRAGAQPAALTSKFSIYLQQTAIGTETTSVERTADGVTISSTGRMAPPVDLVITEFTARYDSTGHPVELTIDATLRGQHSRLHTTVQGNTAATEATGPDGTPLRLSNDIDARAIFLPSPFIAPYEALADRLRTAAAGTNVFLFVPGQGSFTAVVGESSTEQIQTVERMITARRTPVTFQAGSNPPVEARIWADETGRLLRLSIPSQALEVAREDMAAVSTRRMSMARPNDLDVRIQANGFSLAGTLSRPQGQPAGPLPAVVLVSGSGPPDRDETVFGIPIFGQLANALADAGFMVLRYDKRGVGQSGGRVESATLADYADDVRAAYRMMADRKDVDRRRIALLGHSEGGSLALLAASKESKVAALALVATIGTTGADLNMYQVTHALERSSRPEAEKQSTIQLQQRIQQAVLTGKGWETITVPEAVRRQADTPYFQSFLAYDPAKVIKDVDQPMLIVQGALDTQVPPDNAQKLAALARGRKKAAAVDVVTVPGVNHLLVPAKTGEVDEYSRLEGAQVSPEVTNALIGWFKKTLAGR